jgi:branched-chain amino acid transport system substrate-binding protein
MLRKSLVFALALFAALFFVACAGETTTEPTDAPTAEPADDGGEEMTDDGGEEMTDDGGEEMTDDGGEEMTDDGGGEEMTETTYKIGFIAAITGGAAPLGEPEANTAEMIQAQLDEAGGIEGPDGTMIPVEVIILDSQTDPDTATSAITQLINEEEVDLLIAGTTSGNSLAMLPLATEAGVPMISMASAGSIVEDPDTGEAREWIFKTPQNNIQSAFWQGEYLETLGISEVCYLYQNDGYGQDTLASAEEVYPDYGVSITYSDSFEPSETEFPQTLSVQSAGCEAAVVGATTNGAVNMHNALKQTLPDLPVIHGHGVCAQPFIDGILEEYRDGTPLPCGKLLVPGQLPDDDPQKEVVNTYINEYTAFTDGEPISTFGGHAYDAFLMGLEALRNVDPTLSLEERRAAIRDYLETEITDFPATGGVFTMSPEDHLGLDFTALTFVRIQDGSYDFYPEEEWTADE